LIGLSGFDDVYGCHSHSAPQGQFVERDLEPSGLIAGQHNGPVALSDLERDVGCEVVLGLVVPSLPSGQGHAEVGGMFRG